MSEVPKGAVAWLFVGGYDDSAGWFAPENAAKNVFLDRDKAQEEADWWTDHKGRDGRVFPLYAGDPDPDKEES